MQIQNEIGAIDGLASPPTVPGEIVLTLLGFEFYFACVLFPYRLKSYPPTTLEVTITFVNR